MLYKHSYRAQTNPDIAIDTNPLSSTETDVTIRITQTHHPSLSHPKVFVAKYGKRLL